jgi:hypothetical protein
MSGGIDDELADSWRRNGDRALDLPGNNSIPFTTT